MQDDVLKQDHVTRNDSGSIFLGCRRRGKIDMGRAPAVLREDCAIRVVNTGIDYMLLGLKRIQDFSGQSCVVKTQRGSAVRSNHFSGGNKIWSLLEKKSSPIIQSEQDGCHH